MKKLTVGLLAGALAGAVLAYLTEDEPDAAAPGGGSPQARLQHSLGRLRATFEDARTEARRRRTTTLAARPAGSTAVTTAPPSIVQQIKARWQEAVSEGKAASAEKQAELRRKYLEDTHRV